MRWPRGKHNGKRICGFNVKLGINVFWWGLRAEWIFGQPFIHFGPLNIRGAVIYHIHDRAGKDGG